MNVVTLEQTRPLVQVIAVAASLIMVGVGSVAATGLFNLQRHGQIAWRASLRRLSWLVSGISAIVYIVTSGIYLWQNMPDRAIAMAELIFPIALAIQGAMIFSTREEAPLEVLLAVPRPYFWMPLERFLLAFAMQASLAALGTWATVAAMAAGGQGSDLGAALLRWLCPSLFLSGVAIYVTVASHEITLGTVFVVLICFGMMMGGRHLLPADVSGIIWAAPLDRVQPYIWPLHVFLKPNDVAYSDYLLNRIVLAGTGILLMAWAVNRLRDTEQQLLSWK